MPTRPVAIAVLLAFASQAAAGDGARQDAREPNAELYEQFRDPPKEFGLMPYWFWNGKITAAETRRQMRLMIDQGVHAAIVFPWDGLEVPYLSEAWWQVLGDALDAARELGFTLNLNDEFTWPSGHAWDHFQQGSELSRVLRGSPEYRMQTLAVEEVSLQGPTPWRRVLPRPPEVVVAGRLDAAGALQGETLRVIETAGNTVSWPVPEGRWRVFLYTPLAVTGAHNARVDPLNEEAIHKYLELVYEPLARRYPQHLGRTLRLTSADHEGTLGVHPVYTPKLWQTFEARHGYDLRPWLPLLAQPGPSGSDKIGDQTGAARVAAGGPPPAPDPFESRSQNSAVLQRFPAVGGRPRSFGIGSKLRCDYFDTVSELFRTAFVQQVTDWCKAHGLLHAASFYEEQIAYQVERAGDMLAIWRTTSAVEIDALLERARMPLDFKEAVSVAHFDRKKLLVENQGLQGHDSFLSPEKMRLGSNMALMWGADVLVPYFQYDPNKVQWPPQWFFGQPYRPYFHYYADYVRRISFMNSRGRHVAPIVLYYPLENAWGQSESRFVPGHRELEWGNAMNDTQAYYTALQLLLARDGWDYHVVDSHYLRRATIEGSALHLADESFRVLILPPLTVVSQTAMGKIATLLDRGGVILAVGALPTGSPQFGPDDPVVRNLVRHVFGPEAGGGQQTVNRSAAGGAAYFFPGGHYPNFMNALDYTKQVEVPAEYQRDLAAVLQTVGRHLQRELEVVHGESAGIYASHRIDAGTHLFWVVNDSDRARRVTVLLDAAGQAECWDPATGDRRRLPSRATDRGTEVDLQLEPWGGTYVVVGGQRAAAGRLGSGELRGTRGAAPGGNAVNDSSSRIHENSDSTANGPNSHEFGYGQNFVSSSRKNRSRRCPGGQTLDLTGRRWRFTPESAEVLVPYAAVRRSHKEQGEPPSPTAAAPDGWRDEWLAAERRANRSWWLIGPFPYGDHDGYNRVFPPEQEIRLDGKYPGAGGTPVGWVYKTSPTYGVNLCALLKIPPPANSVVYALSDIYAPAECRAEIRVAFADSIKVWWNGQQKIAVHRHPKWMLLRDPWSERVSIAVKRGWNQVLLKVCRSENRPISFLLRISAADGNTLKNLVYARSRAAGPPSGPARGTTDYRVLAPPGTRSVVVPALEQLRQVSVNGSPVAAAAGQQLELPAGDPAVIVFRCGPDEQLERPIRFLSGTTEMALESWTRSALAHYSGRATYETEFDLPALAAGDAVELDCGSVGVTAEVWLNGAKVGTRVWRPYRFDITGQARTGSNALKVIVANSDANWQAQGDPIYPPGSWGTTMASERDRLRALDPSGLVGPVTIRVQRRPGSVH